MLKGYSVDTLTMDDASKGTIVAEASTNITFNDTIIDGNIETRGERTVLSNCTITGNITIIGDYATVIGCNIQTNKGYGLLVTNKKPERKTQLCYKKTKDCTVEELLYVVRQKIKGNKK